MLSSTSRRCAEFLSIDKIPRQARPVERIKHHYILIAPEKCTMLIFVELLFLRKLSNFARSEPGEQICFRFCRTRVCVVPISLHRVKIIGSFRFFGKKNCSKQSGKQSYHTSGLGYLLPGILYLRPSFLSWLLPPYNLLLSWYRADVVDSFSLPWYIFLLTPG